jgi:peptidoglycan/LPS O-acetylase OafA/YrhL
VTKIDPARISPISRYPMIDVLRASAAFLVLLGHTRNWIFTGIGAVDSPSLPLKFFWLITVLEHEAVVVFFVLSGFLVGGALVSSIGRKSFDLVGYLIARFVRIYIVYAPALVVTGLVFWIGPGLFKDFGGDTIRPLFSEQQFDFGGLRPALCHIAGLQGFICGAWKQNPALWSLGYEWVLYLFAPAILGLLMMRGALSVRLAAIALLLCGAAAMSIDFGDWVFWFAAWFLGVFASLVVKRFCLPLSAGLVGLAALVGAMSIARIRVVSLLETDTVIALGTALIIACRPLVTLQLAPRFFSWAANFSYSLYATHVPLVFLTIAALQNIHFPTHKILPSPTAFVAFIICTLIPLVFAYLFSIFTERHTEQLRSWLRARFFKDQSAPLAGLH